ncbi:MAG: hypothetical protein WD004_08325 [Actinomycetota bacterium]
MGLFKKDKNETMGQLMAQTESVKDQANTIAAANKATAGGTIPQEGPDFEPIAGVSLELFVEVSKGLAAFNYDQTKAPEIAASKGINGEDWQTALDGWNERTKRNPAVGQRINALYTGRA